ncbi:ATPase [Calothrix sp. NIES-2100]|uniref:McrB family protein n=1 Tax=Calothrix sp. NIES-2100 TaxID=1954172 RepID=UPI000B5F0992|nr:ATPase [Calothrix sp. NIES-2100]
MIKKNTITWADVAYAVRITTEGCDQEWELLELIWEAWEIIIEAGLATYSNQQEFWQVFLRFCAIVSLFLELVGGDCWEYYVEVYLFDWLENIKNSAYFDEYIIEYIDKILPILNSEIDSDNLLHFVEMDLGQGILDLLDRSYDSIMLQAIQEFRQQQLEKYEDEYTLQKIEAEQIIEKTIINNLLNLAEVHDYENKDYQFPIYKTALLGTHVYDKILDIRCLYNENNNDEFEQLEQLYKIQHAARSLVKYFSMYDLKPRYTLNQFSDNIGIEDIEIKRWIRAVNRKRQVILYGSPGTGKTFIAEHLAKHLIGGGDGFLEIVQFHPSYTYEDFIQGIRPQSEDGKLTYPLVPGRFLEFCKKAEFCQDTCVLIIDEINRANLAQVFGELMYLLEYRDKEIPLAGGNTFRIPKNVRIIGTMNTADRSIALIDHALRRRFAFIELRPNYDVLRRYHQKTGVAVEGLINILQQLNQVIADKNYEIGISFFLTDNLREDIEDIWRMEIEPYLEEYFFNQIEKVENFRWDTIKQNLWTETQ